MAKNTALGGPSHETGHLVEPQETYLVDDGDGSVTNATKGKPSLVRDGRLLTDEERAEWQDGTQLSDSSEKPSSTSDKNESESPQPASDAESPSKSAKGQGKSSASTTDGSTRKTG